MVLFEWFLLYWSPHDCKDVTLVLTLNWLLSLIWNILVSFMMWFFWTEKKTLQPHITVLRADMFPAVAKLFGQCCHTFFAIPPSSVKNYEISELYPKRIRSLISDHMILSNWFNQHYMLPTIQIHYAPKSILMLTSPRVAVRPKGGGPGKSLKF